MSWRDKLTEFEQTDHPDVDRQLCGWNTDSELLLAERFIEAMGLNPLYHKYLDQQAAEELEDGFTHPLAVGTRFRVDGEEQGDHDLHGDMCVDDAVWTVDKATKVNGQWEYECSTFDQNEDDAEEDRGRVRRVFEESEFEGERFHLESDDEAEDA